MKCREIWLRTVGARGFGLVEILMATGVIGAVLVGFMTISSLVMKLQSQSNLTFQADTARRNVTAALNGANSWKATILDPENDRTHGVALDCLPTLNPDRSATPCTTNGADVVANAIVKRAIRKVNDASGAAVYDVRTPTAGLTLQGTPCTGFIDPATGPGNDSCPLRLNVWWWAKCTATTCVNPEVQLQLEFVYNPSAKNYLAFNPANYGTPVFLQGTSPSDTCWAQRGGNLIDVCSGNIGVGTGSPLSILELNAGTVVNPVLTLTNSQATAGKNSSIVFRKDSVQLWNIGNDWTNVGGNNFYIHDTVAGRARLLIDANGNVGMGNTAPAYKLDVTGDINSGTALRVAGTQVCTSAGCTSSSDVRLKTDIRPLENALEDILKLEGVTYGWREPEKYGGGRKVGLIAQQIEKVYPQIVITDEKSGLKSVAYDHLVAPLIEAIKTLYKSISGMENRLASQEAEIDVLRAENARLRADELVTARRVQSLQAENQEIKVRLERLEGHFETIGGKR